MTTARSHPMTGSQARRVRSTVDERTPIQPSLRRLREFQIRPNRDLGQNFLIDSNLLGVIERLAELDERDVVLEIGGGLGVLSEYLAPRVAHVHVVELDRRLAEALHDATDPFPNISLHWGDAMALDLAALRRLRTRWSPTSRTASPPARCCAPSRSSPGHALGDDGPARGRRAARRRARVGDLRRHERARPARRRRARRARGVAHRLPAGAERRLGARRDGSPRPGAAAGLRALVHGAFAHRRKALARSLTLATGGGGVDLGVAAPSREAVRGALVEIGKPADARAETLSPQAFRELAGRLGVES